ncbi:MAG: GHKL domain-containing protein [Lachnospiraceae bacterium]|nr:GHKL domain-containing protein [Lachnospiraceae bacterium]
MKELSVILIALGVIVLCNLVLWLCILPKLVDKKIARFQNDLVNRHYDEVETMYRKMRGWRHDYHNHIQVLKVHMGMGQYHEATEYLEHLEKDLTTVDTVIKTGNVMVDAILNSKLAMMKERNIRVDVTAIVPQSISISGIDLSVLIGNLLDNAMEACMQLKEEERFLRIYMDILKKQLYISVTNSMDGTAKKKGNLFLTNKDGEHGFGLLRIDSIVAKYHGYINRQTESGVFATEVMLPLTGIS